MLFSFYHKLQAIIKMLEPLSHTEQFMKKIYRTQQKLVASEETILRPDQKRFKSNILLQKDIGTRMRRKKHIRLSNSKKRGCCLLITKIKDLKEM
jgi:hypothetical protein